MTKWCKRPIHKDWEEGTKIKFSRKYSLPVFCFIPPTLLLDTSHPDPASKNSSFLHDKSYFFFEWPVYKKKSCSGTLPSEKILAGFYKTAFAHVLIVSPWPSLPGWASQSVIWREVGRARRVTIPSKKDDRARRVTLLIETAFCLSYKRFATFWKETPVLPSKSVLTSEVN